MWSSVDAHSSCESVLYTFEIDPFLSGSFNSMAFIMCSCGENREKMY